MAGAIVGTTLNEPAWRRSRYISQLFSFSLTLSVSSICFSTHSYRSPRSPTAHPD
ncbi:hypothetical protein BDV59DRAFT_118473 [Aspergillus ambiguus]|uniref:uncharacterized protein n=1 Tax=Aspergillus ambiguus TaxID=176160 RepID=UPI003CCDE20F